MGIQFNGEVTINGNVEMYDNGSMKIVGNENTPTINISELPKYIEENLSDSLNKKEYLQATEDIQTSNDKGVLKNAFEKFKDMANELVKKGKSLWINGFNQLSIEVIKNLVG